MSLHPVLRLVLLLALGGALFRYSLAGQLAILAALVLMVGRVGHVLVALT